MLSIKKNIYLLFIHVNGSLKQMLEVIFPHIDIDINYIETLINKDDSALENKNIIYGTYVSTDLINYNLMVIDNINESEYIHFVKLIDNATIIDNDKSCAILQDRFHDVVSHRSYIVNNIKPFFIPVHRKYILNTMNIELQDESPSKPYKIQLTLKEKEKLKYIFFHNDKLQNLWFIYRNFSQLYEKEFIIFNLQGKAMTKIAGEKFLLRMLILYVYQTIYDEIY